CVKALKKEAKAFAPQRSSEMKLHDCVYEILYVPVLKAVCTYEDKQYVGYVNLLNGECDMQYRVSDKLLSKADKALEKVKGAKRLIVFTFLYTLTFIGLGWYYAQLVGTVDKAFIMLMGMTCAVVIPVLSYVFCLSYKRNKLIVKTVETGKMPKAIGAKVLAFLCLLVAIAEMLCFALYVL
ncbi:MAG: hypothetical protein IJX18_00840, partial [Clostridia bacterium]|nr:hypothetical protein [Clostridia bacterium]